MNYKRQIVYWIVPLLILFLAGCQATVPQEEYDQVVADLAASQAEVTRLEGEMTALQGELEDAQSQIDSLQQELDDLQSQGTDAELQLRDLQERADKAVLAGEILDVLVRAALGAETLTDEEAIQLFLDLSSKVEDSGDPELQQKFQAVVLSFGGEQEAIELIQYLIQVISELNPSA